MTCVSLEDIISQSQEGRCCLAVLIGGACCHPVHRVYKGGCQGLGGWATRSWYLICCRSVAQLCLALCSPMDCSTPGFPVLHHLLELAQTHVHWVSDAIQPSHPLSSPSPPASIFSSIRVFSNESVLPIRWPSTGISASASVFPMNIQDWFPLG